LTASWTFAYERLTEKARESSVKNTEPRKVRDNLTAEERERLEKYGSLEFKSAGAVRQK
jgi:hypothetical protein